MVPHIKHPFVLEIPGKIHESNEDSHYARYLKMFLVQNGAFFDCRLPSGYGDWKQAIWR